MAYRCIYYSFFTHYIAYLQKLTNFIIILLNKSHSPFKKHYACLVNYEKLC